MTVPARTPQVSVVMIFLDAGRFIAQAIDSVLAQGFDDFELILVDDGSTDQSTPIAKGFAERHPGRVRYTEHDSHRNLGMSASRNHGASLARGTYLSFLDADDVWLPRRLETFVAAIESQPDAGMIYGPTLYWYSWEGAPEADAEASAPRDHAGWLSLPTDVLIAPPAALREWLETGGGCLPGMNSLIVRRAAFERVGGFEPEFRGLYEDQVFLSKMAATHPVMLIEDVLDYYRQHAGSSCYQGIQTGDYHPELPHPARYRYLSWLEAYCRRQGVVDAALRRALRRQLRPYRWKVVGYWHTARIVGTDRLKAWVRRTLPEPARRALRRVRTGVEVRADRLARLLASRRSY
jgi:glycosyltransferase involved in cell wall biosynthesis